MTRLVAESGWIMNGGLAQVGSVAATFERRSAMSWRARSRSVSRVKINSICESCGTDFERRMLSPSMPARACSMGTVTKDSTSAVDIPSAMVWISTRGGANSGNTSTGTL